LRWDLGVELEVLQLQSLQVFELGQRVARLAGVALVACDIVGACGGRPLHIQHYHGPVLTGHTLPGAAVATVVPAGEYLAAGITECASKF